MRDFLDILLEAPTPKAAIKPSSKGATDYTDDSSSDDSSDTGTDDTSTDTGSDSGDDSSPTDYTATDDDSDPSTDGADSSDSSDDSGDGSDGPTDYTDSGDGSGDSSDDSSDDSTDDSDSSENDTTEQENNRILLDDFSNMFYLVKNTITKLSNIDKSNILINKIATQITSNLNVLKKQVFDYITFSFSKGKYVTNLYKYNYFLEAFKINVEMLKKISIFIPN